MKQFKDIDPLTVATHPNLVATLPDATDIGNTFYFLLIDDHIILADAQYFTINEPEKINGYTTK